MINYEAVFKVQNPDVWAFMFFLRCYWKYSDCDFAFDLKNMAPYPSWN